MSPALPTSETDVLREHVEALLAQRATVGGALQAYVAEMPRGKSRREAERLASDLLAGVTADQLCERAHCGDAWVAPLAAGAATGHPLRYLPQLFAQAGQTRRTRLRLSYSYAYPTIVALLACGVFAFLCATLVPLFESIYDDFGLELPSLTRGVVATSRMIRFQTVALISALLAGGLASAWGAHLLVTNDGVDRLFGQLTAGSAGKVIGAALFTRRLADFLEAGIATPEALRLAGLSSLHAGLRGGAAELAHHLDKGGQRAVESPGADRLPRALVAALDAAAATSSTRVELLRQLADAYDARAEDRISANFGVSGPLAVLGVGFGVALVVIAMFLPLVSLISGLSG